MGPENDIIIKITGEADLDAAQKQMQDLTKRSEEYAKEIEKLKDKEKQVSASLRNSIKDRKELSDVLINVHRQYSNQRKALQDNIATNNKSIKALTDQVKAYKTLHGQAGRAVQQLRAMREELQRMEDAGEFGTQAFMDLAIAAGNLEDQIGDTQQRIRILSSDTKNMDAALGLGDGLAGSFYIATSTAEVFGDELEGLQKAFYKVQAAMSIVSGAQQVYNALQKNSTAMVVINTALMKLFTKSKQKNAAATAADASASAADTAAKMAEAAATTGAAKAQMSLNAAFLANPAGFVLATILALTAAIYAAYKIFDKTERRLRQAKKEFERQSAETEYYLTKWGQTHEKTMRGIDERERASLNAKKKNHASDMEIQKDELSYLKERKAEMIEYANKAIVENNKQIAAARELVEARAQDMRKTKAGSKARQEAVQALTEAENQLNDAISNGRQIYDETQQAIQAVTDKELEIEETRYQLRQQAQQAQIDLMRDGRAKEIEQIKASYKEQMRQYQGNSPELIALRKKLKEKENQEIQDVERKYFEQQQRMITETAVMEAEEATKALTGSEGVQKQLQVWDNYYAERKYQMEENARLEMEEVERSTDTDKMKAAKRAQIAAKLQADLNALAKEGADKRIEVESQYLTDLEIAVSKAEDKLSRAQGADKLGALKEQYEAQMDLYEAQQKQLNEEWNSGALKDYGEYKKREWEIMKNITDAEYQYQMDKLQALTDGFTDALDKIQTASDMVFELLGNSVQAEMDALEEEYTTDWEEAQKNANKKYITEKEYEKKKADLQKKQQKYAKAQAIVNAGINTAQAIVTTLAQLGATPWGIAAAALAGAMGAAQIAVIASKPLSQYEKGRKGGKGEYALVGEKGPEIMYIPEGASIVPNNIITTPEAWSKFGVPELPQANPEILYYAADRQRSGERIDYDRLGAAVAAALPKQRSNSVTVNVDRSGVHVSDGRDTHTYLNTKYNGSWH